MAETANRTSNHPYKPLDAFLKKAKRRIQSEFNRLDAMGFDRMTVRQLYRTTAAMYERLDAYNREQYEALVLEAWTKAGGPKGKIRPKRFVKEYLDGFDPITEYIYTQEVERKRMRLNEAILTAKECQSHTMLTKALRRAANLWYTQTSQYGIDLVDRSMIAAYRIVGYDWVKWNTKMDGFECRVCRGRNGKVYRIGEAPPKAHYQCRCWYTPVKSN